jgi:putative tryptophan/tyrosine transport system substrate-binding protein
MKRREFITLLGSAAAWPVAARAQQAAMPVIGYLGQSTLAVESQRVAALVQGLRELGWTEGRTVAIEYRWAEGRIERYAEIATEFVRLNVDVIVTAGTPQTIAARQATSLIPIVFASAGDPVGSDLVASLARPGGNVTGLSTQAVDLARQATGIFARSYPWSWAFGDYGQR